MGSSESCARKQQPSIKIYTEGEIKNNIQRLFKGGITNNFSEDSFPVKNLDLDNIKITEDFVPRNELTGGKKKFKSSKNRHLNYNLEQIINHLQQGGDGDSDNYKSISTISEFDKIRDFLTREKEGQNGGNKDILDSDSLYDGKKFTLFDIMKGGGDDEDDDDNDDDDNDEDEDIDEVDNDDDDIEEVDNDEDENNEEESDVDTKDYSETSYRKHKSPLNVIPFYSSESSYRGGDSPSSSSSSSSSISATSSAKVNMNRKYSDTSYSQVDNSNYHPFYSTDSSDKIKHPYIKKRFN